MEQGSTLALRLFLPSQSRDWACNYLQPLSPGDGSCRSDSSGAGQRPRATRLAVFADVASRYACLTARVVFSPDPRVAAQLSFCTVSLVSGGLGAAWIKHWCKYNASTNVFSALHPEKNVSGAACASAVLVFRDASLPPLFRRRVLTDGPPVPQESEKIEKPVTEQIFSKDIGNRHNVFKISQSHPPKQIIVQVRVSDAGTCSVPASSTPRLSAASLTHGGCPCQSGAVERGPQGVDQHYEGLRAAQVDAPQARQEQVEVGSFLWRWLGLGRRWRQAAWRRVSPSLPHCCVQWHADAAKRRLFAEAD